LIFINSFRYLVKASVNYTLLLLYWMKSIWVGWMKSKICIAGSTLSFRWRKSSETLFKFYDFSLIYMSITYRHLTLSLLTHGGRYLNAYNSGSVKNISTKCELRASTLEKTSFDPFTLRSLIYKCESHSFTRTKLSKDAASVTGHYSFTA
jgi:CRISPR/Cas system endoribonuclease Cas6 (RAMP superfamily)